MQISRDLIDGAKKAPKSSVQAMESIEDWAIEDEEINKKINKMLIQFEDIIKEKDINKQSFVRFLIYLHTSNMMKLIDNIEQKNEAFLDSFIDEVNELNDENASRFAFTFANRVMVLYRMYVLPEIFSKERIEKIQKGLKAIKEEGVEGL